MKCSHCNDTGVFKRIINTGGGRIEISTYCVCSAGTEYAEKNLVYNPKLDRLVETTIEDVLG